VTERLLTALGAIAAAAAVVGAFVLLFQVLESGGGGAVAPIVVRIQVPGGTTAGGEKASPGHASVGARAPRPAGVAVRSLPDPSEPPTLRGRPRRGPAFEIVRVLEGARVDLEREPDGPIVARLGDQTEFGSPVSFSVVETKPGWLGVTAPELSNGEIGWIARDPSRVDVYWTRYSLHTNLDGRSLELRYGDKVVRRFSVTVGGPGTETPPGRYGVTDGVSFDESPYYGCCALALSGHQTHELPAGWIGGDRLAIHGTPGAIGNAESLGCIRATDESMRFLFARVPLGTPVFVNA
jgi:L,D-transpeptidase catalytic domain